MTPRQYAIRLACIKKRRDLRVGRGHEYNIALRRARKEHQLRALGADAKGHMLAEDGQQ